MFLNRNRNSPADSNLTQFIILTLKPFQLNFPLPWRSRESRWDAPPPHLSCWFVGRCSGYAANVWETLALRCIQVGHHYRLQWWVWTNISRTRCVKATWSRSQPMKEDVTNVKSSLIGRDRDHVNWYSKEHKYIISIQYKTSHLQISPSLKVCWNYVMDE